METLLNEKEAADFLRVDQGRLKELVEKKAIPAYMIAGQFLRFKKSELEVLKDILGRAAAFDRNERVFNKAFNKVRGFDRVKEILRANGVYIILVAVMLLVLLFTVLR